MGAGQGGGAAAGAGAQAVQSTPAGFRAPVALALGAAGSLALGGALLYARRQAPAQAPPAKLPAPAPPAPAPEAAPPGGVPGKAEAAPAAGAGRADGAAPASAAEAAAAEKEAAAAAARNSEAAALFAAAASAAARNSLAMIEQSRAGAIERRAAAQRGLEDALAAKDVGRIAEALERARQVGLGVCAATRIAQSIIDPQKVLRDGLTSKELDEMLLLPTEFRGLTEEEAIAAERAACTSMDREQLQERVVELSQYLAMSRLHARARLEQALQTRLEAADTASLKDLSDALALANAEYDEVAARDLADFEAQLQQQHEEAVASATASAVAEAQRRLDAEGEQLRCLAEASLEEVRGARLKEVISLKSGLEAVEEVLSQDEALVRQAHAYNSLSVAVLGLEDAIIAGRSAEAELEALRSAAGKADAFVAELLARLPVASAELCKRAASVPTEPLLRHQLASHLDDLADAAFVPPGSGLLGEVLGRLFRWLYILQPQALPLPSPMQHAASEVSETERNLLALGFAAPGSHTEMDIQRLESAFIHLESSLGGRCRERAATWMAEARAALILRQTLWAVKARVQCLNAALL